jgi:hypothetical protein
VRVGVVTTSYPREAGDPAGGFVAGFARWLAERGADVEVIAAGPGAARVDGIPVERVDGGGLFYDGGAPDALAGGGAAWARAAAFQLRLAARVGRAAGGWHAAVSHWVVPSGLAAAVALPRGRRHLAIAHSSDVRLLARVPGGAALLGWLSRRADLVYSARHLAAPGAPGRVVPMGSDLAAGDRARGRARFALDGACALSLGRLVPVKGVDLLIDALAARDRGVTLVIAGDGPDAATLRARARPLGDRVRFVGEVRGADKADLFAACDLFCLPSRVLSDGRSEGTPTVIGEALQAGLPIVAARTGGIGDALREAEHALLVPPDPAALGEAIERLIGDRSLRERLSRGARAAGDGLRWSQVGPRLAGRLLERPPAGAAAAGA